MTGEPFHESGIAIMAGMCTSHIGIDAVFHSRDTGFGQDRFDGDFLDIGSHCLSVTKSGFLDLICPESIEFEINWRVE
jgi:hypothetical protein